MTGAAPNRPDWDIDGRDWPNREASRFIETDGIRWHYQRSGTGPVLLLVHGTGAATHSWQGLIPLLTDDFTVVAPDLPGHGFTSAPTEERFALPAMAADLAGLLTALDLSPELVVGHSAGAAILTQMILDGSIAPQALVSLNGALLGRRGLAFRIFSPIVRIIVTTEFAHKAFARRASDPKVVERTLAGTGSTLTEDEIALYARLFRTPGHTGAALTMMAKWDLEALERELPRVSRPVVLVAADNDGFVLPIEAPQVMDLIPEASLVRLPDLGHLAHEERPDLIAELIRSVARDHGLIEPRQAARP
ncbi:alpha/beta fold hydrolase BchO [Thioalkalicoccus limnaeus]|uniref:Alpha/beta fold hydrolase BchO n=1 Tax=Thioalkalicoccus limnaeus TaxID=120681 RepID=A0ABV4BG84_9GAMM